MKNESPLSPIGETLEELLVRFRNQVQVSEHNEPPCPHLQPDESECVGVYHLERASEPRRAGVTRTCPAERKRQIRARISEEKRQLGPLLEKCGYREEVGKTSPESVSRALFAALDQTRPVKNLDRLLAVTRDTCKEQSPQRNLAFLGPSGLAKTTCQLIVHFARLEAGISSYFVDSIQLRDLFRRLNSYDDEVAREAQRKLQPWLSAQSMVWSDAGDTKSNRSTEFAESLTMLLERSSAYWVVSSNLSVEELKQHVDIGPRAVSRLFAQRNGHPAVIVGVYGEDQRLFRSLNAAKPSETQPTGVLRPPVPFVRSYGGVK